MKQTLRHALPYRIALKLITYKNRKSNKYLLKIVILVLNI